MIKPFTARELLSRVRSHLKLSRLRNQVKTQAQLLEVTRARSEQLLELMPTAACVCDQAGRITFFNDHAAKLLGRRPPLGTDWAKFIADFTVHFADGLAAPERETPLAIAAREGRSYRDLEMRIVRPDGRELFLSANIDPLRDAEGRPAGAIDVFLDVTARKVREKDALFLSGRASSWHFSGRRPGHPDRDRPDRRIRRRQALLFCRAGRNRPHPRSDPGLAPARRGDP